MKKVTSALALAALVGTPAAAMANVEFGGDLDVRAFSTDTLDLSGQPDPAEENFNENFGNREQRTGANQRIRLTGSFETDGGVSVNARLNLMNDRWTGDASGGRNVGVDDGAIDDLGDEAPFSNRNHRNVELDYGYVSLPLAGGMLNVGRQTSNWNPMGLTTTDDRRDRISYVRPLGGGHTGIFAYDRRQASDPTNRATDGNQPFIAFLGPLAEGVQYGFLVATWDGGSSGADGAGYVLNGATLVSPYIEGQAGDLNYGVGMHYLGDGRNLYTEDTFAGYVHGGFQMTPEFKLEGQVFHAADGALVANGYDSYSSLINNSPDHDVSPTSIGLLNLSGLAASGGPGTEGQDGMERTLVAARGTYTMMDWTFKGALGWVNYDDGDASARDEDVVFADLQAHYALTPSTTVYATAGYADLDEDENGFRDEVYATSLNLNVQF